MKERPKRNKTVDFCKRESFTRITLQADSLLSVKIFSLAHLKQNYILTVKCGSTQSQI